MWKRFLKWFKGLFSTRFISPIVNEQLNQAMDSKIKKWRKTYEQQKQKHDQVLADYLRTYFDKSYANELEQGVAFDAANRAWGKYCRDANSTSKHLTLSKDAFVRECNFFIKKIKAKKEANETISEN